MRRGHDLSATPTPVLVLMHELIGMGLKELQLMIFTDLEGHQCIDVPPVFRTIFKIGL